MSAADARGKVLLFEGAADNMDRQELKMLCAAYGDVAFVDFSFGATTGYVRFRKGAAARNALAAFTEKPPEISGRTPAWRLLSNSESDEYWQSVQLKKQEPSLSTGSVTTAAPSAPVEQEQGIVLAFDGVGPEADRESLYALCGFHGDVSFVDFNRGETTGYVRFKKHAAAAKAIEHFTKSPVEVGGEAPTWRLLSNEEEQAYKEAVQQRLNERKRRRDGKEQSGQHHTESAPQEAGVVVAFQGAGPDAERSSFYDLCGRHGDVAFVDFSRDESSGYVRFRRHEDAVRAVESLNAASEAVGGSAPTWSLLSEEAEKEYKEAVQQRKQHKGGGKGGKGGGRGGGKGGGNGVGKGGGRGGGWGGRGGGFKGRGGADDERSAPRGWGMQRGRGR